MERKVGRSVAAIMTVVLMCFFVVIEALPAVAEARQYKSASFSNPVPNAIGCDVCFFMMTNILIQAQDFMDRRGRSTIDAFDVENIMDHICDPNNVGGAWLRRIGFIVEYNESSRTSEKYSLTTPVLKQYSKCKRACQTAEEACTFMAEYTYFDSFPSDVAKMSHHGKLMVENSAHLLRAKYCYRFHFCMERESLKDRLFRALNEPDSSILTELEAEPIEFIDADRMQVELSIYKGQKDQTVTTFTREEMDRLKASIIAGKLEEAVTIDESLRTLTTAEFQELRQLLLTQVAEKKDAVDGDL